MPARGPMWTRARLERVMRLRFGTTGRGRLDTAAAAAEMGVSQRTVQRWLHARHGRSLAHIPKPRLEQLIGLLLPAEDTLRREGHDAVRAAENIQLVTRGRGILPAWQTQRWLEDHLVAVVEVKQHGIRQVVVTRAHGTTKDTIPTRGDVLDEVVVPTRFHATVLTHHVLTELRPWRFRAEKGQVAAGYTYAWLADAPDTDLAQTAVQLGLTRRRRRRARGHTSPLR